MQIKTPLRGGFMLCLGSLFLAAPHASAAPSIWNRPLSTFAEAKHDGFPLGSATDGRTKTESVFVLAQGSARASDAANRDGFSHAPVAVAPASTSFAFETTGNLNTARFGHTATFLPNGQVLVAGGFGRSGTLASAELFNPATGSWTPTGNLNNPRNLHTATLLPNGQVLLAGGSDNGTVGALGSAELFDPVTGSWATTGNLNTPRFLHTATLLPNGQVLVAGGSDHFVGGVLASAELFNGAVLGNISTRLNVGTGDNVLIGGFIVTGTQPKKVIVRAIGPSLTVNGMPLAGRLLNPTLALNGPNGLIASNDNWQDDPVQAAQIIATGIPPTDNLESAIVATLPASPTGIGYTAVMSGVNNTTGIGLVEAYGRFEAGQHLHPRPCPDGRQCHDRRPHRARDRFPKSAGARDRPFPRQRRASGSGRSGRPGLGIIRQQRDVARHE